MQAGDLRTLAQLALKMVECANTKIVSLSDQCAHLKLQNEELQAKLREAELNAQGGTAS